MPTENTEQTTLHKQISCRYHCKNQTRDLRTNPLLPFSKLSRDTLRNTIIIPGKSIRGRQSHTGSWCSLFHRTGAWEEWSFLKLFLYFFLLCYVVCSLCFCSHQQVKQHHAVSGALSKVACNTGYKTKLKKCRTNSTEARNKLNHVKSIFIF